MNGTCLSLARSGGHDSFAPRTSCLDGTVFDQVGHYAGCSGVQADTMAEGCTGQSLILLVLLLIHIGICITGVFTVSFAV